MGCRGSPVHGEGCAPRACVCVGGGGCNSDCSALAEWLMPSPPALPGLSCGCPVLGRRAPARLALDSIGMNYLAEFIVRNSLLLSQAAHSHVGIKAQSLWSASSPGAGHAGACSPSRRQPARAVTEGTTAPSVPCGSAHSTCGTHRHTPTRTGLCPPSFLEG